VLAGVEFPPSRLGFAPNKLFVEGTGAAGVVDPNSPPGFEVCCPAVVPKRPPAAAAAEFDGGVAAGVVVPKLNAGFWGAGVVAVATAVAGVDPNRVLGVVEGGAGPAPNRGAAGFELAPNMLPDTAGVEAAAAAPPPPPPPKRPPEDPVLAPKRPLPSEGAVPVDAPAPNALAELLGAEEAGVVFSDGLFPKPHAVPVVPDPNKPPGVLACVALVAGVPPKRPDPEAAGAGWFAVLPNSPPALPAGLPKADPPLAG
jgi:hypothetical protein